MATTRGDCVASLRASTERVDALRAQVAQLHAELSGDLKGKDGLEYVLSSRPAPNPYKTLTRHEMQQVSSFLNSFTCTSASYAGSLPLTRLGNKVSVAVQANELWRTHPFALPSHMPSFRAFVEREKQRQSRQEEVA